MTRHRRRSNENFHAILALWLLEKAQPQAPRPESSPANWLEQIISWGIAVTRRLRIGAKWLQLQCVMVLRGRKGGSLRPQGLSPCVALTSAMGHQQRSDNVPAWSGQPHKADLSKNSPSMLLSATSEALARLRVSDLTAAAPCGPSLFEHTGFCKQGGPVLDTSQARRVSGSWRMAAGRRRSARSRGSEGLCPSRIPKTAQRSASGVLDHR